VFGTFVNVFLVPKLEVGYGVVADCVGLLRIWAVFLILGFTIVTAR
jgi:hypothetical protein